MRFLAKNTPLKTSAVVAKSVAKHAVDRNRLRRAVYKALTPLSGTGNAVVFVQKIPKDNQTHVFTADITTLFTNNR